MRAGRGDRRLGTAFRRFWWAAGISTAGTAVTDVALPLLAIVLLAATPVELALVVAADQVPWLVAGLVAGVWVDRWSRRAVLLVCDVLRATILVAVTAAAWTGVLSVPWLLGACLGIGTCTVFAVIAESTLLPELVASGVVVRANGRLAAGTTAAGLAGSGVAGPLVQATGAAGALLLDAVSYLFSALLVARLPDRRRAEVESRPLRAELADGIRYTLGQPVIRAVTVGNTIWNFCVSAQYPVVLIFMQQDLRLAPAWFGLTLAASGAGGVAGAILAERWEVRAGGVRVWRTALAAGPVPALLLPLAVPGPGVAMLVAGTAAISAAAATTSVVGTGIRQVQCRPDMRGRMSACVRVVSWGAVPVGALCGGALAAVAGTRPALWLIGALFFTTRLVRQPAWHTGTSRSDRGTGPAVRRGA